MSKAETATIFFEESVDRLEKLETKDFFGDDKPVGDAAEDTSVKITAPLRRQQG